MDDVGVYNDTYKEIRETLKMLLEKYDLGEIQNQLDLLKLDNDITRSVDLYVNSPEYPVRPYFD